jgi:hypothetical protein
MTGWPLDEELCMKIGGCFTPGFDPVAFPMLIFRRAGTDCEQPTARGAADIVVEVHWCTDAGKTW